MEVSSAHEIKYTHTDLQAHGTYAINVCVLNFTWPKYQLCIKDNRPIAHWPGRQSTQRANSHGIFSPLPAHVSKGHRQGAVAVQHVVRHHEGEGGGDAEVRHEADQERGHDTDGDGPLGVLYLFAWRDAESEEAQLQGSKTADKPSSPTQECWESQKTLRKTTNLHIANRVFLSL